MTRRGAYAHAEVTYRLVSLRLRLIEHSKQILLFFFKIELIICFSFEKKNTFMNRKVAFALPFKNIEALVINDNYLLCFCFNKKKILLY